MRRASVTEMYSAEPANARYPRLDPVCLGGTDQVGLVEGMTDMWFTLALRRKLGRRIAFEVLRG